MVEASSQPAVSLKDGSAPNHPIEAGPSKPKKSSTIDQMRADLERLGLDTKGKKETLWKRLVKAFQRAVMMEESDSGSDPTSAQPTGDELPAVRQPKRGNEQARAERWKAFLCFDVEATCRGGKEFAWPNEIIEFPVVLLKWAQDPDFDDLPDPSTTPQIPTSLRFGTRRLERIDTFHSYVKPTWQPKLEDFCVALTGITQEMVDKSPTFVQMLPLFEEWLDKHGLIDDEGRLQDTMWVTDGPWDLRDFIPKQLHISPPPSGPPPYFFGPWLNIRQATQSVLTEAYLRDQYVRTHPGFTDHNVKRGTISTAGRVPAKTRSKWTGPEYYTTIEGQLTSFGLGAFEGRQHSGIDDAINISRILTAISERDVIIEPNTQPINPKRMKRWPWMGPPGVVKWEEWMSDSDAASRLTTVAPGLGKEDKGWVLKENAMGQLLAKKLPVSREKGQKVKGNSDEEEDAGPTNGTALEA